MVCMPGNVARCALGVQSLWCVRGCGGDPRVVSVGCGRWGVVVVCQILGRGHCVHARGCVVA
eukprot:9126129-Prorocentrum_lima.AAC.1